MVELDRRDLVLAVGTTAAAISAKAKAAGGTPVAKIDVHTHFAPLKFLDFAEKIEGRPFGLSPLYRRWVALKATDDQSDQYRRGGGHRQFGSGLVGRRLAVGWPRGPQP